MSSICFIESYFCQVYDLDKIDTVDALEKLGNRVEKRFSMDEKGKRFSELVLEVFFELCKTSEQVVKDKPYDPKWIREQFPLQEDYRMVAILIVLEGLREKCPLLPLPEHNR